MPISTVLQESTVSPHVSVLISGVADIDFTDVPETQGDWTRVEVIFPVGPTFSSNLDTTKFVTFVVPTAIDIAANMDTSRSFGFAVDSSGAEFDKKSNRIILHAWLAVKTKYSEILRIAYFVAV